MTTKPTVARIWRGRTRRDVADTYEHYLRAEGIPPLERTALGVQLFREDGPLESWFTTVSYWPDAEAMSSFTGSEVPDRIAGPGADLPHPGRCTGPAVMAATHEASSGRDAGHDGPDGRRIR